MTQDLRLLLLILGATTILILIVHGFWSSRKERSSVFKRSSKNRYNDIPETQFEDSFEESDERQRNTKAPTSERKRQPSTQIDWLAEDPNNKTTTSSSHVSENQKSSVHSEQQQQPTPVENSTPAQTGKVKKEDVLVLFITLHNNEPIHGDAILYAATQNGLQFGDMDIFHRHVNPNGTGPVLFSMMNMLRPGTFTLSNMTNITTAGISLFMQVPGYSDSEQNFKLMLQSAQRIADDLGGIVLDDERRMITPQKIESYKARIRNVIDQ